MNSNVINTDDNIDADGNGVDDDEERDDDDETRLKVDNVPFSSLLRL